MNMIASTGKAKVWTTPGGVHPPENKHQSTGEPIGTIGFAPEYIYPVGNTQPIIAIGQKVLAGELISEASGMMGVPVHASTSGEIIAIESRPLAHASGMTGLCIILRPDQQHTLIDLKPINDYRTHEPSELIRIIRQAGIAGLGGAGFPTAVKLSPKHAITTLILNGTECEPYITADDTLMRERAAEVVAGSQLLAYILDEPRTIIGIEDNKPEAIAAIEVAASGSNVEVVTFPTKYPSGGEKQLIQIVTGKEIPSGSIPASIGIVVQNVGTAVAAYQAVSQGKPLISRVTTVVGENLKRQRNIDVLIGTPLKHILNEHGFNPGNRARVVMGGPMMGFTLDNLSAPLLKTTNCLLAPSAQELPLPVPAQACIRCGLCAEACPASLLPQQLYWYAKSEDFEKAQSYNLFDCIECGACSYVCPSTIPLVQYYRAAKGSIRQEREEKIKSDHARERFEFRKQRIERADAEKEAKRAERKKAAEAAKKLQAANPQKAAPTSDPVAAAMARVNAQDSDPKAQQARLERAVNSARDRLEKAQAKLLIAEASQEDTFNSRIKQAEKRLADAEHSLTGWLADHKEQTKAPEQQDAVPEETKTLSTADLSTAEKITEKTAEAKDAATAAIERAKAKAEQSANLSEYDKLIEKRTSLLGRIQKATTRLATARDNNDENIDAFESGLKKLEDKLQALNESISTHETPQ